MFLQIELENGGRSIGSILDGNKLRSSQLPVFWTGLWLLSDSLTTRSRQRRTKQPAGMKGNNKGGIHMPEYDAYVYNTDSPPPANLS